MWRLLIYEHGFLCVCVCRYIYYSFFTFESDSNLCVFCLQEALEQEARAIELRVSDIQQVLGDLKVHLYAKFGDNINLEADES